VCCIIEAAYQKWVSNGKAESPNDEISVQVGAHKLTIGFTALRQWQQTDPQKYYHHGHRILSGHSAK
jgi:hypothetical protein